MSDTEEVVAPPPATNRIRDDISYPIKVLYCGGKFNVLVFL